MTLVLLAIRGVAFIMNSNLIHLPGLRPLKISKIKEITNGNKRLAPLVKKMYTKQIATMVYRAGTHHIKFKIRN